MLTLGKLRRKRFDLAVEDSPEMVTFLVREMAIPVVLLDRPWNRHAFAGSDSARVIRCHGWKQIAARFPPTAP